MKDTFEYLDAAAMLALLMKTEGASVVSAHTHTPVAALLDMIEGKRGFNRRVIRYISFSKKIENGICA